MKASIHALPAPLLPARPLITDHWPLAYAFGKGVILVGIVLAASLIWRFLGARITLTNSKSATP